MKKYTNEEIKELMEEINSAVSAIVSKVTNDDYIKELLDKVTETDKGFFVKQQTDNEIADGECFTREGNREANGSDSLLLHEVVHAIDFEKGTDVLTVDSRNVTNVHTEQAFSTDYDKYNEQVKNFLDYVALTKEVSDFAFISVKRINNVIRYSRYKQGLPVDRNEITMVSSGDLRALYETLKISYGAEFVPGSKHEMMHGWSLLPTIGEKIMLEIDSDDLEDRNWIYKETHNRLTVVEEPKHK